jgi:hypothetical protein
LQIESLNVGSVDIAGSVERLSDAPHFRLQARSSDFLPGGFFDFALRETFKRQSASTSFPCRGK